MPQAAATMAVLIQELHCPKVSFVLHTARPSDGNTGIVLVEAAPGQVGRCGVTACQCGRMRCGWLVWMWVKCVDVQAVPKG